MKKEGKRYSFIFIPHEGKIKKLHLSQRALYISVSTLSVVTLLALTVPFLVGKIYTLTRLNRALSIKVQAQETRLIELGRKVQNLEMKVADVDQLSRKLRYIALGEEEKTESMMMGVGGVGLDVSFSNIERSSTANILASRLNSLESRVKQENIILDSIFTALNDKKSLLDSTPSIWPVRGWVTSEFGYRVDPFTGKKELHEGLDIATRLGTPVVAPADGIVIYAKFERTYGNTIIIDHGYGFTTLYGHLLEIYVQPGQRVKRGQVIGAVGSTGRSTGPHLHYEVRKNGVPVDPRDYILE